MCQAVSPGGIEWEQALGGGLVARRRDGAVVKDVDLCGWSGRHVAFHFELNLADQCGDGGDRAGEVEPPPDRDVFHFQVRTDPLAYDPDGQGSARRLQLLQGEVRNE